MKLIKKFLIVFFTTSLLCLLVFKLGFVWFVVIETLTLGVFVFLISLMEALIVRDCEKEYLMYKKRQEEALRAL